MAKLLPAVEGVSDPKQLVQVTSLDAPTAPVEPLPTFSEHATDWLAEHWSTVGMIFLGLVALLMVRSVVRSIPLSPAAALPAAAGAATAAGEAKKRKLRRRRHGGAPPAAIHRLGPVRLATS